MHFSQHMSTLDFRMLQIRKKEGERRGKGRVAEPLYLQRKKVAM